jgi:hypothetical protein
MSDQYISGDHLVCNDEPVVISDPEEFKRMQKLSDYNGYKPLEYVPWTMFDKKLRQEYYDRLFDRKFKDALARAKAYNVRTGNTSYQDKRTGRLVNNRGMSSALRTHISDRVSAQVLEIEEADNANEDRGVVFNDPGDLSPTISKYQTKLPPLPRYNFLKSSRGLVFEQKIGRSYDRTRIKNLVTGNRNDICAHW